MGIVERNGLGHPDTICDAVMEPISQALCKAYLARFGVILHHNCDNGLLVAGQAERRLGGGRVLEPVRLIIGDRATTAVGGKQLDVAAIAVEAAMAWFRERLRHVDADRHLFYQAELRPGTEELAGLFLAGKSVLGANDTSAAVGYAPLSKTERQVLETEYFLNSPMFKDRFPESGEDVKVMGVRAGRSLALTVAMPLLDRYVVSEADYFQRTEAIQQALVSHLHNHLKSPEAVTLSLNTLDRQGSGMAGMYPSVPGTSAEDADSDEVGRGNRVNGLIALNRPWGSEAAASNNPISHVGKIYNVLTHLLANRLLTQITGLRDVTVWLCSRIGTPIDQPQMVSVQTYSQPGVILADVTAPIRQIVQQELAYMPVFYQELAQGRYPIC
ncbi:MAG: methionine adenosyltransferase [Candidatus Entotheonellia bacterium]